MICAVEFLNHSYLSRVQVQHFCYALCWYRRHALLLCKSGQNFPSDLSSLATTSYCFSSARFFWASLIVHSGTCDNTRRSCRIGMVTEDDSESRPSLSDKQHGKESQWVWYISSTRWKVTRDSGVLKQWPCRHAWSVSHNLGTSDEKFCRFMHMHSNTMSAAPSSSLTILFYILLCYVVFTLRL